MQISTNIEELMPWTGHLKHDLPKGYMCSMQQKKLDYFSKWLPGSHLFGQIIPKFKLVRDGRTPTIPVSPDRLRHSGGR